MGTMPRELRGPSAPRTPALGRPCKVRMSSWHRHVPGVVRQGQWRAEQVAGSADRAVVTIEAFDGTWTFDEHRRRFRRSVHCRRSRCHGAAAWQHYDHVVFDEPSGAFLVFLDAFGTHLLGSRRRAGHGGVAVPNPD